MYLQLCNLFLEFGRNFFYLCWALAKALLSWFVSYWGKVHSSSNSLEVLGMNRHCSNNFSFLKSYFNCCSSRTHHFQDLTWTYFCTEAAESSTIPATMFQHICNLSLFLSFLLSVSYWSLNKKEWGKVALLCIWEEMYCEKTLHRSTWGFWNTTLKCCSAS